ncbi:MAG: TolC family protein [Myxococcales bacterium]|nr:TolC family protein [Myxococcales bacterium]
MFQRCIFLLLCLKIVMCILVGGGYIPMANAFSPSMPPPVALELSLEDAVNAALVKSYAMRIAIADQHIASQQVRGAWSELMPTIKGTASYKRTLLTPNPFAGSGASGLFSSVDTGSWVTYNERVRRNEVPLEQVLGCDAALETVNEGGQQVTRAKALSFSEYSQCVLAGSRPSDPNANPFLVDNTFNAGISFDQLLYSSAMFSVLKGAKAAEEAGRMATERTGQEVAGEVAAQYYAAVLDQAAVDVLKKSVDRHRETVREARSRFKEGVDPRFTLLSTEVELANVETELVTARNKAAASVDNLAFIIGLPVTSDLILTDGLVLPEPLSTSPGDVDKLMSQAVLRRADLLAARARVTVSQMSESISFARYLPELRLVADLGAVGNIPDDTSSDVPLPLSERTDPLAQSRLFQFESQSRGIFDEAFWGTNLSVGLNLKWTIFEGFARSAQLQQDRLETKKARIRLEELEQSIQQQVARERRNLVSALERLGVQNQNVGRAKLNYEHAQLRVKEGVSSQLELREASDQLDQSQLNRLQAIHDYLVAQVKFRVAIGDTFIVGKQEKADE